jgi:hypothetical protein
MKIHFIPQRRDADLAVTVNGELLIINGLAFDLSGLAAGDKLPADAIGSDYVVGFVERIVGELNVSVALPYGSEPLIDPMQIIEVIAPGTGVVDVPGHEHMQPAEYEFGDLDWSQVVPVNPPVVAPKVVSMRQARLILLEQGLLSQVDGFIDALPEPQRTRAKIEWEYSQEVHRDKELVALLATTLALSSQDLDNLFIAAAAL